MWLRVFGYWLFYAVVGGLILLMAAGGVGGDLGSSEKTKVREGTKVLGALSGFTLGAGIVGLFGDHTLLLPNLLVYGGLPIAAVLTVWAWIRFDADLSR